jgi:hypothetical protein
MRGRVAARLSGIMSAGVIAGILVGSAAATIGGAEDSSNAPAAAAPFTSTAPAEGASDAAFGIFLDRLMRAESNGRDDAANPRSTALGPYQFIKSTFIEVSRRHFATEVALLDDDTLLTLRTNRDFARRAAGAFSRDNVAFMVEQGVSPTFGRLRLAFLVGPQAAVRLLQAAPTTPVSDVLGNAVITANPFMKGMSAADLIARADRDVGADHAVRVARSARPRTAARGRSYEVPAGLAVACSPKLASCRRWIALRTGKLGPQPRTRSATSGKRDARPGA